MLFSDRDFLLLLYIDLIGLDYQIVFFLCAFQRLKPANGKFVFFSLKINYFYTLLNDYSFKLLIVQRIYYCSTISGLLTQIDKEECL